MVHEMEIPNFVQDHSLRKYASQREPPNWADVTVEDKPYETELKSSV